MIRVAQGNQFPHLEGNHKEVGGIGSHILYTHKCPTDFTELHRFSFILKIHPCKAVISVGQCIFEMIISSPKTAVLYRKNNHSNQSEQKKVEKVMTFQYFYLSLRL